jgi:hypothetical protein
MSAKPARISGSTSPRNRRTAAPDIDSVSNRSSQPNYEAIALRAYLLWEARGCPIGSSEQDWLRAEQELRDNR